MAGTASGTTVERTLGLRGVIAISLSGSLGSGIFVLPGLAAAKTGPSLFLAYLLAGLCVLPAAFSKAELGTAMPTAGGTYIYIERCFGPFAGTVAGAGLWLSLLLKSAFALVGFAAYLWVFADVPIKPTALVLLVTIVGLNMVGVQAVSRVQQLIIAVSLGTLVGLAFWGMIEFQPELTDPSFSGGAGGFFAATAFVFVSYAGVTKVAAIANEVKDPSRNLPVGILVSVVVMMLLYGFVSLILVGNIPVAELVNENRPDLRPIYTLANHLGGPTLGIVAAVVAVATMFSMANAGLLSSSRFPFAMSRDDLLPQSLAKLHPRLKTPVASILMTGIVMGVMIVLLDIEKIAKLASAFMIMLFITVNITVIVLRESRAQWYQPSYRSPFYPYVQLFGAVSGLLLLGFMGFTGPVGLAMIGVPAVLLYLFYGRARGGDRRGVFKMMGRRTDLLDVSDEVDLVELVDHDLHERTVVTVPLLGQERSPEMLVEIGGTLAYGSPMEVLQITELPEQTILDADFDDGGVGQSIRRRVLAMAKDTELNLRFNHVISHDVRLSILAASARTHCDWVVMEWRGRSNQLIVRNPIHWLLDHLECNLAFYRDAGVRTIRDILVYPKPGPHDALVARTAAHLAEIHNARLTFCRYVPDDESEVYEHSVAEYLGQVQQMVKNPSEQRVLRGRQKIPSIVAETANYDLLVLGQPSQTTFANMLLVPPEEKLIQQALCSVLLLKTPRSQTHDAFAVHGETAEAEQTFSPLNHVSLSLVEARMAISKKEALFTHIGRCCAGLFDDVGPKHIIKALWERERTQNTAVGEGVAMPHLSLNRFHRSYLGVFTTESPIDYRTPDLKPVDVFFVTAGPPKDRQTHLLLLSSVSKMILGTRLLEKLREARTNDALVEALKDAWYQVRRGHLDAVFQDSDTFTREFSESAEYLTVTASPDKDDDDNH